MKDIKTEKGKKINRKTLIVAFDIAQEKHIVLPCKNFFSPFSSELSQRRINQFKTILGGQIINKIICFTLFLLGVDRETISKTAYAFKGLTLL